MPKSKPLSGWRPLPRKKGRRLFENTRTGKVATEYHVRSLKAKRAGFRNYTQQRRLRESQQFQKLSYDALSHDPDADLSYGGELEGDLVALIRHREAVGAGRPARPGTGSMIGEPGERFGRLLERLGLEPWWKWRYWYSEVSVG